MVAVRAAAVESVGAEYPKVPDGISEEVWVEAIKSLNEVRLAQSRGARTPAARKFTQRQSGSGFA